LGLDEKILEYWENVEGEQTWQYLDDKPWHLGGRIRAYWIDKVISELPLTSRVFLDAGCSEGYFIKLVNERGYEAIGCDISINLLKKHFEIFGERNSLIQCDLTLLPFRDGAFDLVLCSETLEHIPEWRVAFGEILRVNKEFVLLSIPGYESFFSQIAVALGKLFVKRDIRIEAPGGHLSIIRFKDLLSLFDKGLLREKIVASHAFFSFPSGYWPPFNAAPVILRLFPKLERIIEKLDTSLDDKLWKLLVTFSGSIILLGKRRISAVHQ